MTSPWYRDAWVDGAAVSKTNIRDSMRDYGVVVCTVAQLRAMTTQGHYGFLVDRGIPANCEPFIYDSSDTTTADDGANVIVSGDGLRYKRRSVGLSYVNGSLALGNINPSATGSLFSVGGSITAGDASAPAGTVLLKANYDAYPAQALITERSTGAIGLTAYMYQSGSATWKSSYAYGSIGRSAVFVGSDGFKVLTAPAQNVAATDNLTSQPVARFYVETGGTVRPGADNTQTSGAAAYRWSVVYAGTGAINTSDETLKEYISDIPDEWLDAWGDVRWCRFKFKDSVAIKGSAARWHVGAIAQQVESAFAKRGLDAFEIGLLCFDSWGAKLDADGNEALPGGCRYALRYEEALAMEAAWTRRAIARLSSA